MRARRTVPALTSIGLLALAACGAGEQPSSMRVVAAADLPGEIARLSAEKPVVLNLWATWCQPCMAELPYFAEVAAERPEYVFLGLSGDWPVFSTDRPLAEDVARVSERWAALEMPFLSWYLADERLEPLVESLELPDGVFPQTMIFRAGERVAHHGGELSAAGLRALLDGAPVD